MTKIPLLPELIFHRLALVQGMRVILRAAGSLLAPSFLIMLAVYVGWALVNR
jgi:hypothetical protein